MITRAIVLPCVLWGCLAAAGGPPLDATGSTQPAPKTVVPREGCVTAECHPGIKDRAILHGPLNANACDSCHKLTDAPTHRFEAIRGKHDMCQLCHVVETPSGAVTHQPFVEGECLSCHDPHGSRERAMLRGASYADSCRTCHSDITGAHDFVHGPASAGACGACHEPHASANPKLLLARGRDLCLRCHVSTGLELESKPVVHKPVLEDCQLCHDPHATDNAGMLTSRPAVLCTTCHENIGTRLDTARTQHEAVTTNRECLNCHNPHASENARLLKTDSKALCFECHNKVITLKDGSTLQDIKAVIEKGTSLHGAITQGGCVQCHEIHGGGHRRLLTEEFPSDLYYPFSESTYSLCFSCHDRQMVLVSRSTGVTAFRNGDRNLHYEHVNRADKGRSCRICHDAHASNRHSHIRNEIPYGPKGWQLPIRFEQLADGGKCGAGCHAAFEYNRSNPVVYPARTPADAWNGANLVPGVRAEPTPPKESPKSPARKQD